MMPVDPNFLDGVANDLEYYTKDHESVLLPYAFEQAMGKIRMLRAIAKDMRTSNTQSGFKLKKDAKLKKLVMRILSHALASAGSNIMSIRLPEPDKHDTHALAIMTFTYPVKPKRKQ